MYYIESEIDKDYRGVASLLSTSCNNLYLCVTMAFWPPYWGCRDDSIIGVELLRAVTFCTEIEYIKRNSLVGLGH